MNKHGADLFTAIFFATLSPAGHVFDQEELFEFHRVRELTGKDLSD